MGLKLFVVFGLLHMTVGAPVTLDDLEVDDMEEVGSYVREVRAAAPENYHKSYENEGDGEIGYSRKKNGGGKKGYQHFDSYHKKAGDNYEYQKENSFGHDDDGEAGAHSHTHEKVQRQKPKKESDDLVEELESEELRDKQHDSILANASDGNGGVEAHGHDKADYKLPEKYTYGSGEAYDF